MRKPKGSEDGSSIELLPILQKESEHPCFNCAKCCTYVALEIDKPTTMKEYDYVLWYLLHQGVSVFVDLDGVWHLKFESRCQHLSEQGLCGIYETRPAICRDFDWRECENHLPPDEPADKWVWDDAEDFLAWFEENRPKTHARFKRYMRRRQGRPHDSALSRVKVTDLPGPPGR